MCFQSMAWRPVCNVEAWHLHTQRTCARCFTRVWGRSGEKAPMNVVQPLAAEQLLFFWGVVSQKVSDLSCGVRCNGWSLKLFTSLAVCEAWSRSLTGRFDGLNVFQENIYCTKHLLRSQASDSLNIYPTDLIKNTSRCCLWQELLLKVVSVALAARCGKSPAHGPWKKYRRIVLWGLFWILSYNRTLLEVLCHAIAARISNSKRTVEECGLKSLFRGF